ncbi:hypothetical protein Fmac_026526 [Flemingia macrophylla]|uniref:Ionotropic glutamate receptor C-terminal domain-containing protein n=1 Tax=Flemingia macrophylla TaxID=520843 RepID=A0ABD1LF50_9FABA
MTMCVNMLHVRKHLHPFSSLPFYLILFLWPSHVMVTAREVMIPVGAVLDLKSPIGSIANSCIWMAYHDFYEQRPGFQTRLDLRTRDSDGDTVTAAYAASELIWKEKVEAIIGPQTSEEARHVINLGNEHDVPILSFATSPSLSPSRTPVFRRVAQSDSSQVKAIAAIAESYGWRQLILVYEDTEYGNGLVPHLVDALEAVDTKVPYRSVIDPNSEEPHILEELTRLKQKPTRVFLVHMRGELGSRFFSAAEKAGLMSEGYGWVMTQGLSSQLDPLGQERMENMQGVLGVRPKVNNTERLEDFKKRWKALSSVKENINHRTRDPTLLGLWAYDTVWALALAVENATAYGSLASAIVATSFDGLSGFFELKGGELEASVVEVFNVVGHKERVIGYWSSERGLFRDDDHQPNDDRQILKQMVWPGYTTDQPPKRRFGVPVRKGFTEFVKVEKVFPSNATKVSGFVVDVFLEAVKALPFSISYEFVPVDNYEALGGSHADHNSREFDAGVGDITIIYYRTNYFDFTLPYLDSGVSMVVSMKRDQRRNIWIFLKPLSWGLWLTTGAALVLTGFVVWFMEHNSNAAFSGTPEQQLGIVFWFSFSTLVFAHLLIITQSYTASLASLLTIESLRPEFIDIKEIQRNNYFVGYQNQSFVKTILINELGFSESRLKAYNTPEDYHEALSKGTNNDGVAAIFDETPYINIFLSKYDNGYAMVGPIYKTNGFAFVSLFLSLCI